MFFKQRRWIVDDSRNILGVRFFDERSKKQQVAKERAWYFLWLRTEIQGLWGVLSVKKCGRGQAGIGGGRSDFYEWGKPNGV